MAAQAAAKARPPEKVAHKWQVFRAICAAKARVGVSERALAVLDALLSLHPETMFSGENLIAFPSNRQLALRGHGMAPATLRRHLAALVDAGLIIRRDSPNGKRFARKGKGGEIEMAFGFDLSPLAARADELEAWAEEVRAEEMALRLVRERISLCRRDIVKMIAAGVEEGVPVARVARACVAAGQRISDWASIHGLFRAIVELIPRTATRQELEPIGEELTLLADEVFSLLENHAKTRKSSGDESQTERHLQDSNPNIPIELDPASNEAEAARVKPMPLTTNSLQQAYSLTLCSTPAPTSPTTPRAVFPAGVISSPSRLSCVRCWGSARALGARRNRKWGKFPPRSSSRRSCRRGRRSPAPAVTCANSRAGPRRGNSASARCSWR